MVQRGIGWQSFGGNINLETKRVTLFHAEEIQVHGSAPRTTVRMLEGMGNKKKTPGRIVVSREQVFDTIDEWYCGNGHVGMVGTST
jgi:hypothetical protein